MKLNKELTKKGFYNIVILLGNMFIFNIISSILFWLSYVGIEPTGNSTGGIISLTEYKTNYSLAIFSWILFLIAFSIFYTKYLKKNLKKQIEIHWLFVVISIIVNLIFYFIEFMLFFIVTISNIGIFSTVSNYPDSMLIFVVVYIIGYIIIDLIKEIANKIENKKIDIEK